MESHSKVMLQIERQHVRNMLNEQICAENKNKIEEFTPRYETIQKDLRKLKEEMNTIVKKNQKMLKSHIKKPVNLNGSNFDYIESKHNLDDKQKELIDKQRKVEVLKLKNTRISKTLFSKLDKKSFETSGDTQNFYKLNGIFNVIQKAEQEYENYLISTKELEITFRNLAYNLQLEFISKNDFINIVAKSTESSGGKINDKMLDDILHEHFANRLSIPSSIDKINVLVKLKSMFITGGRDSISTKELIKKLTKLVPDVFQFTDEAQLNKARQDLKEDLQDECSEEYQIINAKIKDLVGLHNSMNIEKNYVTDIVL